MTYVPSIVFYHAPCVDGICAAAVVSNYYKNEIKIEYRRGMYSNPDEVLELINICRDKHVLMVDFTFKPDVLEKVVQSAKSIVIIDHHIYSKNVLADYTQQYTLGEMTISNVEELLEKDKAIALFEMEDCGTSLAYKFFYPNVKTTKFIEYVRDVDLGKLALPSASAFKSWTRGQPLEIKNFAELIVINDEEDMEDIFVAGRHIDQFVANRIDMLDADETSIGIFSGIVFPYTFTDYAFASDLANRYIETGYRLGVAFYFTRKGLGASLRSSKDLDCSKIAAQFGGGGHAQASGFNIPWEGVADFANTALDKGIAILGEDYDANEQRTA